MVTHMGYPMVGLGLDYMVIQKRDGNTSMMNGKEYDNAYGLPHPPHLQKKIQSHAS